MRFLQLVCRTDLFDLVKPTFGRQSCGKYKTGLTVPTEGMTIMRLPTGLLRAALLLPVSLLLGTGAGVA
ncbi:MAG: hypothetical protein J7493_17405, partial [Porphyrobacter sp.]|nr:hypothetical protein [Porphyrobacter sp.]